MKRTIVKLKYLLLPIILITMALTSYSQNKIGENPKTIHDGSLLELESLTKGLRLPRIPLNNVNQWTLDGTAASGMMIFNESGTEPKGIYYWNTDAAQWTRVVNKSELSTLIANYLTQNTSVRDSIIKVINTTIASGALKGKDFTSNSPVIKVLNGSGAAIKAAQLDIDKNALGNLLNTSPVSDSLSVAISNNTVIRDSIKSVVNNTITSGDLKGKDFTSNTPVIKILNGSGAAIKAAQLDIDKNALGKLLNTSPVSDSLSIAISNNTVIRDSIVSVLKKTTTNSLSMTNGTLTSTVNGVTSSPGVNLISSADNGLSSTSGNVQLGGTLIKPTELSTTTTNTLSITGLQDGDVTTDGLLTVTPGTGIIRKINGDMLSTNVYKLLAIASTDGQKRFATPAKITDVKKLQVYRNGINVEFTQVDDTHIDLEDQAVCYADDEIKIIQLK